MRKKHGPDSPSLSEKALLNLGHHHHANEEYLIRLAQEEGDPNLVAPFAERLSELLADTVVRAMAGDPALLPHMWQNGFAVDKRRKYSLRNVDQSEKDVSHRPSRSRSLSAKARKAISKAQHERWARYHAERDGKQDLRGSPESTAKQQKSVQRHYRDPKWRKAMLKRMAAMRARKPKSKHPMSEETKAKLRAARYATLARKRGDAA